MSDIYQPLYARNPSPGIVGRAEFLCRLATGNRVLHVGCADAPLTAEKLSNGELLHSRLTEVADECIGVDTDEAAVRVLRDHGFSDVIAGDASSPTLMLGKAFDVVILGEVLEHVGDAGALLSAMQARLSSDGVLVVTVPNAFNALRFLHMIVRAREVVHRDHLAYYSAKTVAAAGERAGLELVTVAFTDPFAESGVSNRHRLISSLYGRLLAVRPFLGQSVIALFAPNGFGDESPKNHLVVA